MHYCSILESLYEHKQLEKAFTNVMHNPMRASLASYAGTVGHSHLTHLKNYIQNWGLQYFLSHYLLTAEGFNIIKMLLDDISSNYSFDIMNNMESYGVFVSGRDSNSGDSFLKTTDAEIFGHHGATIKNSYDKLCNTDLCILIKYKSLNERTIALFGEVEGNVYSGMHKKSYWDEKKSQYCYFGFCVTSSNSGFHKPTYENIRTNTGVKSYVRLFTEHNIIDDFRLAISYLEIFFSLTPSHKLNYYVGQKEIALLVRDYWNKPLYELISFLRQFISTVEPASLGTNPLSEYSVPKIITKFRG